MMNTEQSELLEQSYQRHLEYYLRVEPEPQWLHQQLENQDFCAQLKLLWGCSDFVATQAAADNCDLLIPGGKFVKYPHGIGEQGSFRRFTCAPAVATIVGEIDCGFGKPGSVVRNVV